MGKKGGIILVGKLVRYKEKIYEIVFDYGNGYLEIKEQCTYRKFELVKKTDVVEVETELH
ncbi:hypothetical protein NLX67_21505 [Domibacillus sp. A3M-37]|uniref:hypothetical protein n=1 Tax=Domibacillus sp. A3M-37 TaxID=2962037 RepID=UPI0020B74F32|nr:hypothetical protein [Domibacillus sp. A3M-37]MCP3764896.1 hypothetical protein [Domibacillus sp. A3M-37]